jgi:hypothetical protein
MAFVQQKIVQIEEIIWRGLEESQKLWRMTGIGPADSVGLDDSCAALT